MHDRARQHKQLQDTFKKMTTIGGLKQSSNKLRHNRRFEIALQKSTLPQIRSDSVHRLGITSCSMCNITGSLSQGTHWRLTLLQPQQHRWRRVCTRLLATPSICLVERANMPKPAEISPASGKPI